MSIITRSNRELMAVNDWVICRRVEDGKVTASGIVLPDTDSGSESAEVLSVGPTVEGIRVGDRIKFSGAATGATVDGTHFYFVRATEVICLTRAGTVAS